MGLTPSSWLFLSSFSSFSFSKPYTEQSSISSNQKFKQKEKGGRQLLPKENKVDCRRILARKDYSSPVEADKFQIENQNNLKFEQKNNIAIQNEIITGGQELLQQNTSSKIKDQDNLDPCGVYNFSVDQVTSDINNISLSSQELSRDKGEKMVKKTNFRESIRRAAGSLLNRSSVPSCPEVERCDDQKETRTKAENCSSTLKKVEGKVSNELLTGTHVSSTDSTKKFEHKQKKLRSYSPEANMTTNKRQDKDKVESGSDEIQITKDLCTPDKKSELDKIVKTMLKPCPKHLCYAKSGERSVKASKAVRDGSSGDATETSNLERFPAKTTPVEEPRKNYDCGVCESGNQRSTSICPAFLPMIRGTFLAAKQPDREPLERQIPGSCEEIGYSHMHEVEKSNYYLNMNSVHSHDDYVQKKAIDMSQFQLQHQMLTPDFPNDYAYIQMQQQFLQQQYLQLEMMKRSHPMSRRLQVVQIDDSISSYLHPESTFQQQGKYVKKKLFLNPLQVNCLRKTNCIEDPKIENKHNDSYFSSTKDPAILGDEFHFGKSFLDKNEKENIEPVTMFSNSSLSFKDSIGEIACRKKHAKKESDSKKILVSKTCPRRNRQQKCLKGDNCKLSPKKNAKTKIGSKTTNTTSKKTRAAKQASSPYASSGSKTDPSEKHVQTKLDETVSSQSPPARVCNIFGTKVTIVDEERKVLIVDLIPPETCDLIRQMAEEHVALMEKKHGKNSGDFTWRTLYTYTKMDLPCSEVKGMANRITDHIMTDVKKIVGEIFGKNKEAQKLRPRSWKEPHLLKYQKVEGKP